GLGRACRAGGCGAACRADRLSRRRSRGGPVMSRREGGASPVSFPVHVARLPKKGTTVAIEADAEQRAALADVHGLRAVDRFVATLEVVPWKQGGVRVAGRVTADIVQDCVVTLEPVAA